MKHARVDKFKFVEVYEREDFVYPWVCVFERYRTRLSTTGQTRLKAMKDAVKLSNQALAHELAEAILDRGKIDEL